ncbi:MAG: patatin [Terriglobia bacterium]|nr:MAG: patatin [Terriglobia bacterium]
MDGKRSLILAGGGMRVAYQAGVLRALAEEGITFQHADGTSGGTINLAMLLSGLSPIEMVERWETLPVRDFVSFLPFEKYFSSEGVAAMGDARSLVERVFPHLGIDIAKIRAAQDIEGTFNVCNFSRKVSEVIPHQRMTVDYLVAGISLPIFLPAVQIDGAFYMDSVWIRDANLMEAVRRGADELWVVWCIGNTSQYHNGAFRQYVHMIEIAANGKLFEEFEQINAINRRIESGEAVDGRRQPIRVHLIKPANPLPLDPDYYLGRIDARTLAGRGYADAKQYLVQRGKGIALTPEATKMADETLGFTFREKMAGGFTLGETDPEKGAKAGHDAGNTFTMHATIEIHDLYRFLADPNHLGSLTGQIDFPPVGLNLPSTSGVFNLFSPTSDPAMKYMVYELGFETGGRKYYMAGHKDVKQASITDLWKATTTLYTQLHEGTDKTGPVVGAGVLTLGMAELMAMIPTMHATNAKSPEEAASAVARFGRFFLGELWDTYVKKAGA